VSLWAVLREWGRIGCIGFGGPPTHIKLLRQLCVERKRWVDAREFEDAIAVCNLMPGPASTQLAIFCARRLRAAGCSGRGAAFIVPDVIVLLALSGAGPAAIGAILGSAITLARALTQPWQYAVLAGALVALLALRRGVVLILPCASAIGVVSVLAAGTVSP